MSSDDETCLRWLASSRLVSQSRSFPTNCNRAKKQRLLQSSMFVSTIISWDYGYQFFLLCLQVVVSKLIPSIFCEGKTPKIREMVSFELGKEIEKDVFRHVTSVGQRKNSESLWAIKPQTVGFRARMLYHWATEITVSAESEGLRFDSSWGLKSFSFSHAREKKKNIFLYFFTELKTYHISYSNYKHDTIDVTNPSSMQDACHVKFVVDFAHRRVFVAQW